MLEHGSSSNNFALILVSEGLTHGDRVLVFYSIINPTFEAPYDLRGAAWELFGKVERVFEARGKSLRNLFDKVTWKSAALIYVLVYSGILFAALSRLPKGKALDFTSLTFLLVVVFGTLAGISKSRIHFRYFGKDKKDRREKWRERREKLLWLFFGAILTLITTFIAARLKR